ncbi:MAG: 3-dehydroquinate synthase [Bacteroidota bacterium]
MKALSKQNVFIGSGSINDLKLFLKKNNYPEIVVLADENTFKYCYPVISAYIGKHLSIRIKSSENNKNIASCVNAWKVLSEKNIGRNAVVINLGGGIICDMGGFIASTYKRGIDFIHIPTSLLAMCDACIGGKLAVNFNGLKNYIGLFKNPAAIAVYPDFLKTLPEKQIFSGFAEIIKHAIIADKRFFNEISELYDFAGDLEKIIIRSIRIKSRIVDLDVSEKGIRKSLNFGHSIGHALESFHIIANQGVTISHGEAVAAGIIAESFISYRKKLLDEKELNQIISLIQKFYKKIIIDDLHLKNISDIVTKDKKNELSAKLFSLIAGIGQFRINEKVSDEEIMESLKFYQNL